MKKNFIFYSLFIFLAGMYFATCFCAGVLASEEALISMIQEYGYNGDFTNRLVVETDNELDCSGASAFVRENNVYYLQYSNEEDTKKAYEYYSSLSYVDEVNYDEVVKSESIVNNELYFYSWGAEEIGADIYNQYLIDNIGENKANEIIVAVLDTGIDTDHPWFKNRIASGGINYSSSYSSSSQYTYEDDKGHGTHVSGIIVDLTLSNVKILPVKVLNNQGKGDTTSILNGIKYVIDLKKQGKNIVAMNMSFGVDGVSFDSYWHQKYTKVIEEAYDLGILTIAAAGNGRETASGNVGIDVSNTMPANITKAITISAVEQSGNTVTRSKYSNYGKYIDYAAPGTFIDSAVVGGGIDDNSGTSMAAPHATAAIALLKSDSIGNYSNSEIEKILKEKAIDLGTPNFDNYYGNGMINIDGIGTQRIDDVIFSETKENHTKSFLLELSTTDDEALIYYTLDGSEPTLDNGILYTSKINITSSTTVKAKAYVLKNGTVSGCSNVSSYNYSFSYSITVVINGTGTTNIIGEKWYKEGISETVFFYVDIGNYISELKIDGRKLNSTEISSAQSKGYEFKNINSNHTVEVTFKKFVYTITATCEGTGDISQKGTINLEYGTIQKYELILTEGSYVERLFIDGIEQSREKIDEIKQNGYTFIVHTNHSIHVVYKIIKYNIVVYKEGLREGILSDIILVDYGLSKTYYFEQPEGYKVKQIKIDGNIIPEEEMNNALNNGYRFSSVVSDHELFIEYEMRIYTITSSSSMMADISPLGEFEYSYNSNQEYKFKVMSGYYISKILVDGKELGDYELELAITNNTYTFTGIKSDHTIHVIAELITYDINVSVIGKGRVSPAGSILGYRQGATETFKFIPDTGNYVDKIVVDGNVLQDESFDLAIKNGYILENIVSDHDIEVTFKLYTFNITAIIDGFGSITPHGVTNVEYGNQQQYTFSANNGYHIDEIIVDGQSLNDININLYKFEDVTSDHTIEIKCTINQYTILSSVEGEGSITPLGEITFNYGESQRYNLIINEGYYVDKLIVDNFVLNDNEIQNILKNGYLFSNIFDNHTIHVSYKIKTFTITKEIVEKGIVEIENNGKVNYGDSVKVVIKEMEGYTIDKVYIDNELTESKYEYIFENVKENHSVKVEFVEVYYFDLVTEVGGSITTNNKTIKGEDVTYYFTPKEGYYIKNVYIDGKECGVLPHYTFYNIDKKHSVEVIYQIKVYKIIVRTFGNGYATSTNDLNKVEYGNSVTINFKPNEKNEVYSVLVNGDYIDIKDSKVVLDKVTSNLEVVVTFKEKSISPIIMYAVIGFGSLILLFILLKFRKIRRSY